MSVNQQKVELLHKNLEHVRMGGGQSRIDKQHAKGKMTARERLEILFDEGSFVEIGALVKHRCVNFGQDKKDLPGEGVVTGYGTVDGKLVYAFAQDFTVEGGSLGEMHASKIVRVLQLSLKMGAPCVGLNDSGGARIQEAVDALSGYGRIFFENTIASGVVPQISAIMGPSAGGAVYSPALTDFIYMVEGTSQMFITGPAVVKSVTGEDVTAEKLGGAMTHNSISGVSHFIAKDDEDCLNQIRYLLGFLPSNNMEEAPIVDTGDDPMRMYESLNTLLPDNSNAAYDMYDVIKSIVDNGEYY
ncbi:MAG: carboxyl transferase domain-containing protein, partial [Negativicoccus succinicivorans]|nr:carboxyl transferase domain-containing protein [Negativicoccus succinicivorans]